LISLETLDEWLRVLKMAASLKEPFPERPDALLPRELTPFRRRGSALRERRPSHRSLPSENIS
jgi:hypothetical protein